MLSHAGLSVRHSKSNLFIYLSNPELVCNCSFFSPIDVVCTSSFLLLFIFFALWLVSCLGGQGAHGVADGLVVWVDARQVLQDALKELWVLHHIIVIFLLHTLGLHFNFA